MVPIVFSEEQGAFDGLQPSQHFIDGLRLDTGASTQDLASIQRKLFTWYTAHSLTVQADFLVNSISCVLGPA